MDPLSGDSNPHASRLRAGRVSEPWQTYFITKCTEKRHAVLAVPAAAEIVVQSLSHVRLRGKIKLLAFVIMPDHYHVLFTLLPGQDLSKLMTQIGSFTANQIRKTLALHDTIWQGDGFFDRACRDDDVLELAEYIHHNPVRKGLALHAEDWVFSSAHPSRRSLLDWEWWI